MGWWISIYGLKNYGCCLTLTRFTLNIDIFEMEEWQNDKNSWLQIVNIILLCQKLSWTTSFCEIWTIFVSLTLFHLKKHRNFFQIWSFLGKNLHNLYTYPKMIFHITIVNMIPQPFKVVFLKLVHTEYLVNRKFFILTKVFDILIF